MVNWDPKAQTALSNEEVIYRDEKSKLYHLKYYLADQENVDTSAEGNVVHKDAKGYYAVVATTRPETIMGDTAMCINPKDPKNQWLKGHKVIVPLVGRVIPVIEDRYVDIEFGTGCLKVTPAHDTNDHMLGKTHNLETIDIFNADGTISGAEKGTWERTAGTDYIALTIDDVVYRGVLVRQTIDYTDIPAIAIAALSSSSGSTTLGQKSYTKQQEVWAVKADAKAAIKYTANKINLPFDDGTVLEEAPVLPTEGKLGTNVSWKSSDESILTSEGKVKGQGEVTLTMTVSKDDYVYTKDYTIVVEAEAEKDADVYFPESMEKNTEAKWWTNFSKDYYTLKKGGKAELKFYNYSNKAANWNNWCLVAATAERGAEGYAEHFALRADNYAWFAAAGGNTAENTTSTSQMHMFTNSRNDFLRYSIGISYRLGSLKASVKKTQRSIENDDVLKGNNSNNVSGEMGN